MQVQYVPTSHHPEAAGAFRDVREAPKPTEPLGTRRQSPADAARASLTPPTNRGSTVTNEGVGSEGLSAHSDYSSVTIWESEFWVLDKLASTLLGLLPEDDVRSLFVQLEHGARGFGTVLIYPGLTVYAGPQSSAEGYVHVEIKGEGSEAFGDHRIWEFFRALEASGVRWRLSRFDYAWDGVAFSPDLVNRTAVRGDIRIACRRSAGWRKFIESAEAEEAGGLPGCAGRTCYLGRRAADRQLCVYDRRGFNRAEFRVRGKRAAAIGPELLAKPPEEWASLMLGHLLDFVSFVDRDSDANPSRRRPLPWWRAFIGDAKAARLRLPRIVPKIVEAARESRRRATRQLAIQAEVFGRDWIHSEIDRASDVLRVEDRAKANALGLAVKQVAEELGEDVARLSAWRDQTLLDMARSW